MCPSRRIVLGGALAGGAALLTGCGGGTSKRSAPTTARSTSTATDQGSLPAARIAEQNLLRAYAATLRVHPSLAPTLSVPYAHHRAHAGALAIPALTTGGDPAVPSDPRGAVHALIALEQRTSDARIAQSVTDLEHGSLLAALAAAEAVHVDLLTSALPGIAPSISSTSPTSPTTRVTPPPTSHRSTTPTTHAPQQPTTHSSPTAPIRTTHAPNPPTAPPRTATSSPPASPSTAASSAPGTG